MPEQILKHYVAGTDKSSVEVSAEVLRWQCPHKFAALAVFPWALGPSFTKCSRQVIIGIFEIVESFFLFKELHVVKKHVF